MNFYDNAGRLDRVVRDGVVVERRYYDELGRVIQTGPEEDADTERLKAFGISPVIQVYAYNEEGNLDRMKSWTLNGKMLDDIYYKSGATTGYDGADTLNFYTVVPNSGSNTLYTNSYTYFDSAKETQVTANRGGTIAITTSLLDANGNVYQVSDSGAADKTRTFVSDAFSRVLRTTQNGSVTHTMIVNGEVLGSNSDSAVAANFGSAYQSGLSNANLATPTVYNVQSSSENLRSIAKSVWGDATLWYLIADANNLAQDAQLNASQLLKIPARVNTVHNDADTFKTYNAAEAIGDTRPTLPPPPAKKGCGAVGQIVMIAVAVIATIYTAGAASGLSGSMFANGLAVLGGTSTLTAGAAFGAAALGGAVGSIASQTVGIAIGAQDKFSWKGVAMSALGSGVSAGVASLASESTGIMASIFKGADTTAVAARSMVSNMATQGIANLTGLQKGFIWRSVAAAGVGAAVGNEVSKALNVSSKDLFTDRLWKGTVSGFAAGTTTALMRGGKVAVAQIATDAFGNALGSSLAARMRDDSQSGAQDKKLLTDKELRKILKDNGQTDYVSKFSRGAFARPEPGWDVAPGSDMNWSKSLQEWRANQPDSVLLPAVEIQGTKWDSLDHLAYMFKTTRESMEERLNRGGDEVYSSRISQSSYYRWAKSEASNPVSRELWHLGGLANNAAHNIAASAQGLHRIATDQDARTMALLGLQDNWNNLPRIMAKQADSFSNMSWRQRSDTLIVFGF